MNQDDIQKNIEKNVANKEKRYNKTELSIAVRWSTNCAIQMLTEEQKKDWKIEDLFYKIGQLRDKFIEMDREWMMDNMSEEIILQMKVTRNNFGGLDTEYKLLKTKGKITSSKTCYTRIIL